MTRFLKYLNENEREERYNKYFNNPEDKNFIISTKKKKVNLWEYNTEEEKLEKLEKKGKGGESITLVVDVTGRDNYKTHKKIKHMHYYVPVIYNNKEVFINVDNIETPEWSSRGESLKIQATKLIATGNNAVKNVIVLGKEHDASKFYEFTSGIELRNVIIDGFKNNNKVPDNIADDMERIINSKNYASFDWGSITSNDHKNQIGKYFGELLVGLCLFEGESSVFTDNLQEMLGKEKIKSFLMPKSPSFKLIDSIIKTENRTIAISNKKGGGTGASFYSNIVPLLENINNLSGILLQMKEIYNEGKNVLQQIWEWGFKYTKLSLIKNKLDNKNNIFNIYYMIKGDNKNLLEDKDINLIMDYIKNSRLNDWKIDSKYLKAVKNNLPYSLTHFFLYQQYYILTKDEKAKKTISWMLNYWQVSLQDNEWKKGQTSFIIKKTRDAVLTFSPTRGGINQIWSPHAKLNFILK